MEASREFNIPIRWDDLEMGDVDQIVVAVLKIREARQHQR